MSLATDALAELDRQIAAMERIVADYAKAPSTRHHQMPGWSRRLRKLWRERKLLVEIVEREQADEE